MQLTKLCDGYMYNNNHVIFTIFGILVNLEYLILKHHRIATTCDYQGSQPLANKIPSVQVQ